MEQTPRKRYRGKALKAFVQKQKEKIQLLQQELLQYKSIVELMGGKVGIINTRNQSSYESGILRVPIPVPVRRGAESMDWWIQEPILSHSLHELLRDVNGVQHLCIPVVRMWPVKQENEP